MAAYLSMASFIPIGLPLFVNHSASARLSPTTSNPSVYDNETSEPPSYTSTRSQIQTQTSSTLTTSNSNAPDQTITTRFQGTGSEFEFEENTRAKMSIFATPTSQAPFSNSVPPPSYTTSASPNPNRSWFSSLFNLSSSTPPSPPPPEVQVQVQVQRAGVNLTPLPPCYKPSNSEEGIDRRRSISSSLSTITNQQPEPQELPRYSSIISTSTLSPSQSSTTTLYPSTTSTGRGGKKMARKSVSWIPGPTVADDAMYEEYELRRQAEREGRESEWCCGCFWVGPAQPWQAYYVY